MRCNHNDCFTCPYPDCVIGLHEVNIVDKTKLEERRRKRKEYDRKRYAKKKAERMAKGGI